MPNQPPNFQDALDQLLIPTMTMVEAAKRTNAGDDESHVADAVGVPTEVVLIWHELHLGFQALVDRLEQLADNRIVNCLNARNASLLDLDLDDLDQVATTLIPVAGSRLTYRPAPERRPRPPTARERFTKLVEAEYQRQAQIERDLDVVELGLQTGHKANRQTIEVEIVESRLATIKFVEDGGL